MLELKNAIFPQSNNKSCGLNGLPAEIYKHSFEFISPCLLALFNKVFETRVYPDSWVRGYIHKGGWY